MKTLNIVQAFCFLMLSSFAGATEYIIEFSGGVSKSERRKIETNAKGVWTNFNYSGSKYFRSVLRVETQLTVKEIENKLSQIKKIKKIEETISIKPSSIIPATSNSLLANDPLVNFQWGFDYLNQSVINEVDDLENLILKGSSDSDIGYSEIDRVEKQMKRDAVVAVIDTGIDLSHPDLKENIFRNTVECENGEIPFGAEASLDDNKYPGDCMGWNFTGRKELGTNRAEDFVGHGTHVAGIISAVRNNEIGVSGLSNKIKILPLKVLSKEKEETQARGTSSRLAEAILYATSMKVDVINLSLGWPISFDKDHLRNAVLEAIDNKITIIAAAGNNDHNEPIFPCSYEGVICVGSIDPNKNISDFSNFGGHVDVLAPGNNILSTSPTGNTSLYFDIKGYDIKNGTSQSAPYVAGLAALIKGINPEISEDELKAKIFQSTKGPYSQGEKYSSGGKVHFDRALHGEISQFIRPDFKNLSRVKVDLKTKNFEFDLSLKNFGAKSKLTKLEIKDSDDLIFDKKIFSLSPLELGGKEVIKITGRLKSIDAHVAQKLKIEINQTGVEKLFVNNIRFFVEFSENEDIKRFPITGAIPDEVLSLNTINLNHGEFSQPAYYSTKEIKKQGTVFSIFNIEDGKIKKNGSSLLKNVDQIISVHRLDANLDGKTDYLVRGVHTVEDENDSSEKIQTVQHFYFNEKMKPLFVKNGENRSIWNLKFEKVILEDLDDFALVPYDTKDFGRVLIPVFHKNADNPEADTNPNPFARLRKKVFSSKIFYFLPEIDDAGKVVLITRTFNTNKFIDDFKRKIQIKPFEQVYILKMFKQDLAAMRKGEIKLLLTHYRRGASSINYVLTIENLAQKKWKVEKINGSKGLDFSNFAIDRAIDLGPTHQTNHFNNLNIVLNEKLSSLMWEQVLVKNNSLDVNPQTVHQTNKFDPVQIPIKTYIDRDRTYRFYQTPSRIFMHLSSNSGETTTSLPVHISSFLPGVLFQEQHYPIVVKSNGNYPALYVDSTAIASRNVYTVIAKGDELRAPISLNVNVPEKCQAKNPELLDGVYHYSLLCFKENGKGEMIYFPVAEQEL